MSLFRSLTVDVGGLSRYLCIRLCEKGVYKLTSVTFEFYSLVDFHDKMSIT